MTLSKKSRETLIDLVENKLSTIEVWDRDDRREVHLLQQCLRELSRLSQPDETGAVVSFSPFKRRRGRPPKTEAAMMAC